MTTREHIDSFLARRTIALVGLSRNTKDFSRTVLRELGRAGRTVYGINPQGGEGEGRPCFRALRDLPVPADAALLMVPQSAIQAAVQDCAAAGISLIWIYGTGRPQKLDDETREFCRANQLSVINGFCPLMFLRSAAWPHRLHGWFVEHGRAFRTAPGSI